MEFDKSKVYTALNADEVKVGSKGYFADTLAGLCADVLNAHTNLRELTDVYHETIPHRFRANDGDYNLFYLVEEPKEKKFRPYKDTYEMIEDFKIRYNSYGGWNGKSNPMYCPLIWLKDKDDGQTDLVRSFWNDKVFLGIADFSLDFILKQYTYLDGSPCGIEE